MKMQDFCIKTVIIIFLAFIFFNISFALRTYLVIGGFIDHEFVERDKSGEVLDCENLNKNLNEFPFDFETINHFEKSFSYTFKQCRSVIDTEKNNWCNNKISKLKVNDLVSFDNSLKTYCNYTPDKFVKSYDSQYFKVNGKLVYINGYFKNIELLGFSKPKSLGDNYYNMYKLCILSDNYSYCKYQKNKKDSMKAYEQLISIANE